MIGARAIGWKAHAALLRADGEIEPIASTSGSAYCRAGGELVWTGERGTMHPRAIIVEGGERPRHVRVDDVQPWRPDIQHPGADCADALREGCVALARDLGRIGAPAGFAPVLAGKPLAFPLQGAAGRIAAVAAAIDDGSGEAFADAALPLIGFGPGLTPSGDDFVGAALFVRRMFGMTAAWEGAAQRLLEAATSRTHAIAAALFADLAEGQSYEPLHRVTAKIVARQDALDAARALTGVGHSSGWDMLAGFIIGASGGAALRSGVA